MKRIKFTPSNILRLILAAIIILPISILLILLLGYLGYLSWQYIASVDDVKNIACSEYKPINSINNITQDKVVDFNGRGQLYDVSTSNNISGTYKVNYSDGTIEMIQGKLYIEKTTSTTTKLKFLSTSDNISKCFINESP